MDLIIGIISSLLITLLAIFKKTLTIPAAITASAMVIAISVCTGYGSALFLIISYIVLVVIDVTAKNAIDEKVRDVHDKTGARTVTQVLANGLFATVFSILYKVTNNTACIFAYYVCVTEACGDSIASDLGVLSKKKPVSILTFHEVDTGISGGVSCLGLFSSFIGCLFMASLSVMTLGFNIVNILFICVAAYCGVMTDSVLGASVQAKYVCSVCGKHTEKKLHCNTQTRFIGGIRFITNSVVNVISNLLSGIAAFALAWWLL